MSAYQTIKAAAAQIEDLAKALEASEAKVAAAQETIKAAEAKATEALAKVAAAETEKAQLAKTAAAKDEEAKAKRASLAKTAADLLLDKGLISTSEKRDQFAGELLNHDTALDKIAKLAEFVQTSRLGTVVADTQVKAASAEDSWARHVQAASSKLGIR